MADIDISINPNTGRPYRVLIVDDSEFVIKQLSAIMLSASVKIVGTANNGRTAVEKYKVLASKQAVEFVTLDITMPVLDGYSTLVEILSLDPKASVVMVSALGHADVVKRCLTAGAKGYILKPFDRDRVLKRISVLLG
jgi:two-component system chemotaxis response regulator CheY